MKNKSANICTFSICNLFLIVLFQVFTGVKSNFRIKRSSQSTAECIRYEFHEPFGNGSKVDSVMRNCQSHSGYLDKLTRFTMNKRISMVNVTFECCGKQKLVPKSSNLNFTLSILEN